MILLFIIMLTDEERPWKVLNSRYLIKRPWLTARCDCVELPDGLQMPEYYVLEYPDWVNTLAITKGGKFLMIRQYRHGIRKTCYELCAGVCEPTDNDPLDAAKRELLEETGYGNGEWSLFMTLSANTSTMNNLTYCYLAVGVEKIAEQNLEKTEDITVHLLTVEEVRILLSENKILQSLMAAPLWKYMAINKLL